MALLSILKPRDVIWRTSSLLYNSFAETAKILHRHEISGSGQTGIHSNRYFVCILELLDECHWLCYLEERVVLGGESLIGGEKAIWWRRRSTRRRKSTGSLSATRRRECY